MGCCCGAGERIVLQEYKRCPLDSDDADVLKVAQGVGISMIALEGFGSPCGATGARGYDQSWANVCAVRVSPSDVQLHLDFPSGGVRARVLPLRRDRWQHV